MITITVGFWLTQIIRKRTNKHETLLDSASFVH